MAGITSPHCPPPSSRLRFSAPSLIAIAAIWAAFGLVDGLQTVFVMRGEGMHHAWLRLLIITAFLWIPWALATPFVIQLGRRFPPVTLRPLLKWPLHLVAAVTIGLAFSAWSAALDLLLHPYADISAAFAPASAAATSFHLAQYFGLVREKFLSGVLSSIVLYATILAVSYVLDARARLARQQTETARLNELLTKAQLDALRHQIEPHFLFNTLNSIAGLVRENRNNDAVNMIAGLSDFLRRVLENSGHSGSSQQVPLAEELEFAQRYLDIQKVRFPDRLSLRLDVPADLLNAQVPSLILQPMVENAIKHGIAKRAQGGEVRIAAARSNGRLTLSVYNDGPGLTPPGASSAPGIGIANTRARLTSLYGSDFDLSLRNQPPAGVEASLSVPFSLAAAPASATASRHE